MVATLRGKIAISTSQVDVAKHPIMHKMDPDYKELFMVLVFSQDREEINMYIQVDNFTLLNLLESVSSLIKWSY